MFAFRTKAQNLEQISDNIPNVSVPALRNFTREQWDIDRSKALDEVARSLSGDLIVRSSALGEDSPNASLAGAFESVICLDPTPEALSNAIEAVFQSMSRGRPGLGQDRVLIQELVGNVAMAGVIFSRDLSTGSPYLVINYDDSSGRTDSITGGVGENSGRTLWIYRGATERLRSPRFQHLVDCFLSVERFVGSESIDVEFAVDDCGRFMLLQVRPLFSGRLQSSTRELPRENDLVALEQFCRGYMGKKVGVLGDGTLLGQMPDWNPAEIIGRTPKRLARDLYAALITNDSWAIARARMGYRDMSAHRLMISLAGQPFVDVAISFNSFIPQATPDSLGEKLVTAWLHRLASYPHLHDKVEFEIATPNFRFDLRSFYSRNYPGLLDDSELTHFTRILKDLTVVHVADRDGGRKRAAARLRQLEEWQEATGADQIGREDLGVSLAMCKRFGAEPFALFARHAFAAKTLLLSLEQSGAIEVGYTERVSAGIRTVATEFASDVSTLGECSTVPHLMAKYGHLRPGTYEVGSPRYDEMPRELFLESNRFAPSPPGHDSTNFRDLERELAAALTKTEESDFDAEGLLEYFVSSTQERERSKFIFTRTLSDVLRRIANRERESGLTIDETGYLKLDTLLASEWEVPCEQTVETTLRAVAQGRQEHELAKAVRLPALISSPDEIWVVPILVSQPNFITQGIVLAPVVCLDGTPSDWQKPLEGSVIAIESADPGFDWIFSRGISGLVTRYGGTNSHMAIRCAEFGLPAAIGCGEELYNRVSAAVMVELDCLHRSVRVAK